MEKIIKVFLVVFIGLSGFSVFSSPVSASTTVRFLYDGDGVRVAKIVGDQVTLYGESFEKDLGTGEVTKYYSAGKKRVAVKKNDNLAWLIPDHHASIVSTTNNTGTPSQMTKYYPYGDFRNNTRPFSSRAYIGEIKDPQTDLYYLNSRYYNPKSGNFITADQVADSKSRSRYGYGASNPIAYTDPSGQCVGPLVFLLPACVTVANALTAAAPALVSAGTKMVGVGITSWAAGKIVGEVSNLIDEPGSSEYQTNQFMGQTFETLGTGLTIAGPLLFGLGATAPSYPTKPEFQPGRARLAQWNNQAERNLGVRRIIEFSERSPSGGIYLQAQGGRFEPLEPDRYYLSWGSRNNQGVRAHELDHLLRQGEGGRQRLFHEYPAGTATALDEFQNTRTTINRMQALGYHPDDPELQFQINYLRANYLSFWEGLGDDLLLGETNFNIPRLWWGQ